MSNVKKIAHLSDVHIQLLQRHNEYREVFSKLYDSLGEKNPDLIVITGDLFHSRVHLSPEAIDLANELFVNLTKISDVVIIAGNHDAVIKSAQSRLDSISPVVEMFNKNISEGQNKVIYLKGSDVYKYKNVDFGVYSVLDYLNPDFKKFRSNSIKIALYHGMLSGSKLDNGRNIENDEREIHFDQYDRVLLGDIHLQQKIKENAYYAGSLIQRNFGEHPINHGYLFHDLSDLNSEPEFIKLPNEYGFYKLFFNGLTFDGEFRDIPDKATVRILHTKDQDKKRVESEFKKSYPKISKYIIDRVVEDERDRNIDVKEDINDLFSLDNLNALIDQYYSDDESELRDSMIELNKEIYEKVSDEIRDFFVSGEFQLNSIEFDNMFSYGEGNIVDFKNMEGTIGLFSPNRMGKSSFLNTIKIAIYGNKGVVSKQEDMINSSSDTYWTKINLSKNGDIYVIEREGKKTASGLTNKLHLYKNGEPISGSITETNNDIKKIFGDADTFDKLFYISQRPEMFLDLLPMQRKEWIYNNLGVDIFEILHRVAKDKFNDLSAKVSVLKDIDYETEIKIKKLDIADTNKHIDKSKSELTELRNDQSELIKEKDSIELIELNEDFYKNLRKVRDSIKNTEDYIENSESNLKEYKEILEDIDSHTDLKSIESNIVSLKKEKNDVENSIQNEEKSDRLIKLESDLERIKEKGTGVYLEVKKLKTDIQEPEPLYFTDEVYKKTKSDLDQRKVDLVDVNYEVRTLQSKIKDSKNKSNILSEDERFESEDLCQTCPLLKDAFNSKENLKKYEIDLKENLQKVEVLENKIEDLTNSITDMDEKRVEWDEYKKLKLELESKKSEMDTLLEKKVDIEDQIDHERKAYQERLEDSIQSLNRDIENSKKRFKDRKEELIKSFKEKITSTKEIVNSKKETLLTLNKELVGLQDLEREYEKNNEKQKHIEELSKSIKHIDDMILKYEDELEILSTNKGKHQQELDDLKTKQKTFNDYKVEIDLYSEYSKITHKDELPLLFVKNILGLFQSEINEVINKISTFNIKLEIENNNINSYVIEHGEQWNTDLACGMERFVINIAFRIAISKIGNIVSPNFIIIDEGFNSMDGNYSQSVPEVFEYLKRDFDYIFIVSHNDQYRDYVDSNIEISKVNGKSYLSNT